MLDELRPAESVARPNGDERDSLSAQGGATLPLTAGEEARRGKHGKVDPEVYDLIVRARQTALQFRSEASVEARKMLERALTIDPGLARGYSGLAMVTVADYANQWNGATEDNLTKARELAHKAIETDETEPQGHVALAICLSWMRRLDEAEHEAERAIALDPNSAQAFSVLGSVRDFQGRHEDAVGLFTRAHRLDPQFDMSLHLMGRALLALGRFDEAEIAFKRRLALAPRTDMTRFYLACLCGLTGRYDEANRYWQETQQVNPTFSVERLGQVLPYRNPSQLGRLVDGLRNAGITV